MGGRRVRINTLLSLRAAYHHRDPHVRDDARLRRLGRARDTAMRGRAPRASRGRRRRPLASVARVNAFPHRSRCSSVRARSGRRVPSVLLRTDDDYTTAALLYSAAVAGEVTAAAAVTVGRPRGEGAHVNHEQRDRSHAMYFARSPPLPLTGYLAHNYYCIIRNTFRAPPGLGLLTLHTFFLFYSLVSKISIHLSYDTTTRTRRRRHVGFDFRFSRRRRQIDPTDNGNELILFVYCTPRRRFSE